MDWRIAGTAWQPVRDDRQARALGPWLPVEGAGGVVITSRDPVWRRHVTAALSVEVLGRTDAVRFLLERTGKADRPAARALATALGDLPLALEQAGAYVEAEQLPLGVYVELLHQDAHELFAEGRPPDYQDTVATTWPRSFAAVAGRNPAAHELLRLLAFLGPDSIPHDLLVEGTGLLPAPLTGLDGGQLDRAIGALGRYSLVKRSGDLIAAHRLVQAVVRDELDGEGQRRWAGLRCGW